MKELKCNQVGNRRRRTSRYAVVSSLALGSLVVAGCSSNSSAATSGKAAAAATASSTTGAGGSSSASTSASARKVLKEMYWGGNALPTGIDPNFAAAMGRLGNRNFSTADIKRAQQCFQSGSCTLGSGKETIGILSTVPPDAWVNAVAVSAIQEAMTFPNVGKIIYQTNSADLSTTISQIHAMIAKGVSAIVSFDVFGAAATGAYQAAKTAGIPVVLYQDGMGPAGNGVVTSQVTADHCQLGDALAKAAAKDVGPGSASVALFTGVKGNQQAYGGGGAKGWFECATAWFKANRPNIHVADQSLTQWTEGGDISATSALISSGKKIDAILYDNSVIHPIINTYLKSHATPPAVIGWGTENAAVKSLITAKKAGHAFKLGFTNTYITVAASAVYVAMQKLAGKTVPAEVKFPTVVYPVKPSMYKASLPSFARIPSVPGMPAQLSNWVWKHSTA